jgi:hypothetical protein
MLTIALVAIGAEVMLPATGAGVLYAQQRACMTDDPPCPAGPPVTVSVQPVSDTMRSNPVTVYFSVTGLTTGSFSASSTVDGTPTATPSWQYSAGGSVGGNVQVTLTIGTHTVAITFCESGRSPAYSTDQTTVIYQPLPAPPAMAPPIATVERGALYRRAFSNCAGCANTVLSYQTPAYHSLDEDRSVILTYSSAGSAPTGFIALDVNPNSATLPDRISLSLQRPDGTLVPLSSGGTEVFFVAGIGVNRVSAQFRRSTFNAN